MAQKRPKSTTALSKLQEDHIAKLYNGKRSPSSGASWSDQGDIRYEFHTDEIAPYDILFSFLGECKTTQAKSISLKKEVWEKIAEEAAHSKRRPCMFIRFHDENGKHLDLVIRDVNDDCEIING